MLSVAVIAGALPASGAVSVNTLPPTVKAPDISAAPFMSNVVASSSPLTTVLLPKVIKDPVSVILASFNCVPSNLTTLFVTMFEHLNDAAVILFAPVIF